VDHGVHNAEGPTVTGVLILARASQEAVVAALAGADADVGPTSSAGFTAVWCTGDEPILALTGTADLVAVWDEPEEGHVVLHLSLDGAEQDQVWPLLRASEPAPPTSARSGALADGLARFFGTAAPSALAAGLESVRGAEHVTDLLEEHFELPALDPVQRRAVTVHRGRTSDARIAGRLAARGDSPVEVTHVGDGWTVLGTDHAGVQQIVSLAVAAAAGRRDVVLHLWRGDGPAAGFELVHREHVVAHGSWDDGWRRVVDEDWQHRDAAAEVLARRVGGEIDMPALRSLLRARTRSSDPLARLVDLLGAPTAVLDVLDGTPSAPQAEQAEPAGWWRALREESSREADGPFAGRPRWLQLMATAVSGLLSVGVLIFGVAVVVTDGALLDQPGVTLADWLILPVAVVGIGLSSWSAHRLVRRGQLL
jgi:hypothetical protein